MFALDLDSGKATALYSFAANENGCAEPKALIYQDGALYGATFADSGAGRSTRLF